MPAKIIPFNRKNVARRPLEVLNQTADSADVYIYDEISGWGITAASMVALFKSLDVKTINLHINSPGGSVFDGVTIYNMLMQHSAKIVVYVDGLAASIASLIAMAGDEIIMASNAMMMVHNPWTIVAGNSADLRKQADVMDQIQKTLVSTYVARTGQTAEAIQALLDGETWLTADEALAKGFATSVAEAKKIAACIPDPEEFGFTKTPKNFISAQEDENRPALDKRLAQLAKLETNK